MSDLKPSGEPQDVHGNLSPITHNLQFGYNAELSKVTLEFLEHSKHVVQIIEKMSKMFASLKYDMNGNINKITMSMSIDNQIVSTFQMSDLKPSGEPQDVHGNVSPITHNLQFGYNAELSKVTTLEFLEHSKHVVQIIEKMGKMFAPLKYDMNGNINKITATYLTNIEAHYYLEGMVLTEQAAGGGITIDALQWLRRGLHFLATFFDCVLEDADEGNNQQNLVPFLKIAYETILQRYHGWTGGQLFNIMCRFAPNRKELYKILSSSHSYNEEHVVEGMRLFKTNLLACINHLVTFYHDNNLENEAVL